MIFRGKNKNEPKKLKDKSNLDNPEKIGKQTKDFENHKDNSIDKTQRVKDYLFENEKILQNYKNFYATDRRLIQLKGRGFFDVAYNHITTIEYKRHRRIGISIIGILFVIVGVPLFSNSVMYIGGFLLFIGLILMLVGLISVNLYILHTTGNQEIKFKGGNDEETQNFLKVIRKQMN